MKDRNLTFKAESTSFGSISVVQFQLVPPTADCEVETELMEIMELCDIEAGSSTGLYSVDFKDHSPMLGGLYVPLEKADEVRKTLTDRGHKII